MTNGAASARNIATPAEIQALAAKVLAQIDQLFTAQQIHPNPVQQQMLASHVKAMALRSLTGEPLPEIEAELFEEISPRSVQLAQQIVDLFGNLPQEESWLLSVHFDVARENQ